MNVYFWKIDIILNCGREITAIYEGEESNSLTVGKTLLEGDSNGIITLGDSSHTSQYFIKRSEIAYMAISVKQ